MKDILERNRGVAFALFALAVVALGFFILLPFVPALLWATVLSILLYPLYRRLVRRLERVKILQKKGWTETVASLIATIGTLVLICIPFLLMGLALFGQISEISRGLDRSSNGQRQIVNLESIAIQIDAAVKPIAERLGVQDFGATEYVREHATEILQAVRAPAGKAARALGFTVLTLVVALLTMFFMLRDGHLLKRPALELIPLEPERSEALFKRIFETVHAVFIGTVAVAILQGTIMGVAYAFVGMQNALLLGIISVILCVIPLLGAPLLYIPICLGFMLQGEYGSATTIFLVGLGVSQIDNVLKPFLISGRVNLHPIAIFFSILGGVLLFGPIGVMAGPMVLTILLALQDVLRENRIAPAVTPENPA